MEGLTLKKSTTTKMTVKKASVNEGTLIIDGEDVDFMKVLTDNFDGCIFDISVAQKTDEDLDVEGIDVDSVGFADED